MFFYNGVYFLKKHFHSVTENRKFDKTGRKILKKKLFPQWFRLISECHIPLRIFVVNYLALNSKVLQILCFNTKLCFVGIENSGIIFWWGDKKKRLVCFLLCLIKSVVPVRFFGYNFAAVIRQSLPNKMLKLIENSIELYRKWMYNFNMEWETAMDKRVSEQNPKLKLAMLNGRWF